jgi:hypothetical protein
MYVIILFLNNLTKNNLKAEAMIIKKGFTANQLRNCLQEYQGLGVIHVDKDRTTISIEG